MRAIIATTTSSSIDFIPHTPQCLFRPPCPRPLLQTSDSTSRREKLPNNPVFTKWIADLDISAYRTIDYHRITPLLRTINLLLYRAPNRPISRELLAYGSIFGEGTAECFPNTTNYPVRCIF